MFTQTLGEREGLLDVARTVKGEECHSFLSWRKFLFLFVMSTNEVDLAFSRYRLTEAQS